MDAAIENEPIIMCWVLPPRSVEIFVVCNSSVSASCLWRFLRIRTLTAQLEDPEIKPNYLAQCPRLLRGPNIFGQEPELLSYCPGDLFLRGNLTIPGDQLLGRLYVGSDWLLRQHVLARLESGFNKLGLISNRKRNNDADDIGTRKDILEGISRARVL